MNSLLARPLAQPSVGAGSTNVVPLPEQLDRKAPFNMARVYARRFRVGDAPGILCWNGDFYAWDGNRWGKLLANAIRAALYWWLDRCIDTEGGPIKPNSRLVSDVEDALRAETHVSLAGEPAMLTGSPLDGDPSDYLVAENGLLDLRTRTQLPPCVHLFSTTVLPIEFRADAGKPLQWLAFLEGIFEDRESINLLQEWFGLVILTSDTSHQKALLIVGPKRSGKGTILRVFQSLVGAANSCSPTLGILGTHFGLESLIGKRAAFITDARMSGRADIAAIAEAILRTTGEDSVTVPRKHRTDWSGTLTVRFTVATNELPALADASAALSSRFLILRMTKSFYGKEDHDLTNRLLSELPAILLWAMDGLDRLRARGRFIQPASSQELVDELESLSSPVTMFAREKCSLDPIGEITIADLYRHWCDWCREQGRDHPGTASDFGRKLKAAFPGIRTFQPRRDGRQVRCYGGIRLRNAAEFLTTEAR